ncbi:PqqD family peptide modification chaperone [Amorphus sp. MBR-141]
MDVSSKPTNPIYRRRENVLSADFNDELVMMSVETGQYFNLNAVGAHIWRLMETPQSLDDIVAALTDAYDAPEAAIREEALRFLARLEQEEMVASGSDDVV